MTYQASDTRYQHMAYARCGKLNGIPSDSRMAEGRFLRTDMLTPQLLDRIRQLNMLAQQRGQTLAQMALSWVLRHPEVTSVLVGASSKEQLVQNLQCLESAPFSDEELAAIG